jgi:hypothetical protein
MLHVRVLGVVAVAVVCALASTVPALADPPIPTPISPEATYAAGQVCPFPVRVTPGDASHSRLHIQRSGEFIVTGYFSQTVTNLSTGRSLRIKSSGPLRIVFHDDGTSTWTSHGSFLWTFFAEDAGGPGLFIFTGRSVLETNAEGFATSVSGVARVTRVCDELA